MKFLQVIAGALGVAGVAAEGLSRDDIATYKELTKYAKYLVPHIRNEGCKPKDPKTGRDLDTSQITKYIQSLGKPVGIKNSESKQTNGKDTTVVKHMRYMFKDGSYMDATSDPGTTGTFHIACFGKSNEVEKPSFKNNAISATQREQLIKAFKAQDKSGDGKIPSGAAYSVLSDFIRNNKATKELSSSTFVEPLLNKLSIIPSKNDGAVDLSEIFCVAKYLLKVGEAYHDFKMQDKDNSGSIDVDELKSALYQFYTENSTASHTVATAQSHIAAKTFIDQVDSDKDNAINFWEFEKDAFQEIHYKPEDCQKSVKPTLDKENDSIKTIFKNFAPVDGDSSTISSEDFYQFSAQLEARSSHKLLGCTGQKSHTPGNFIRGPQQQRQQGKYSLAGTTNRFLQDQRPGGNQVGTGGQRPGGNQVGTGGQRPGGNQVGIGGPKIIDHKTNPLVDLSDGVSKLREDAYENTDALGFTDFLKAMQDLKDDLPEHSDFDKLLQMASFLKPVDCKKFSSCGSCTSPVNAGLCGWTAESNLASGAQNPNKGACTFVDKDEEADNADASAEDGTVTCMYQCRSSSFPQMPKGQNGPKRNIRGGKQ